MSDKAFLDTNILVYAIERDGSKKSAFALGLVRLGDIYVSTQVLGEFYLHYYDALILASARLAGIEVVYSEDMADGQNYDGVTVTNPFCRTT